MSAATSRYRADFDPRSRHVRFAGPGGFYDAEVIRGSLAGLVGLGLHGLGHPSGMLGRVRRAGKWNVQQPRSSRINPRSGAPLRASGTFVTKGEDRRILIIAGREVVVFRFRRPIPVTLLYALHTVFQGTDYSNNVQVRRLANTEVDDGQQHEEDGGQGGPAPADGVQPEAGPGVECGLDALDGQEGRAGDDGQFNAWDRQA